MGKDLDDENNLERQLIKLVAIDRIYATSSSFDGKLERRRNKSAKSIKLPKKTYEGERVYARIEEEDRQKARGMREGIDEFSRKFPTYGEILNEIIEEKRTISERHLYFGMSEGRRLTNEDYISVLRDMGLSPSIAEKYYEVAIDISRNLMKKREEKERSVLIGDKKEE